MRGKAATLGSVDILVRAVLEEFPELDGARVRAAVERGVARAASASLDTEGYRVVDMHLAKVEATEESSERAKILRELSATLEERDDADRALVVRLSAFGEAAEAGDVEVLLRLARITDRYDELPLDTMNALIDIQEDGAAERLSAMAAAWQKVGRPYYAADCLERVLLVKPDHDHAYEALEMFYRSTGEWPVLVDLLHRRAMHVHGKSHDKQRAELFREIGVIYDRELGDPGGALDAFREADKLVPGHPDTLAAMARLSVGEGAPEEEALDALERLAKVTVDQKQRADVLRRAAEHAKLSDWDRAQRLFEESRACDPDLPKTVDSFASLMRDQGREKEMIALLLEAAARPAMAGERSRWLTDAADSTVGLGDTTGAVQLYMQARKADPENHKAGVALVELCLDTGALVDLAPILDEIIRTTDDPARLRRYLMTRSKIAMELGDKTGARSALSRAVDLDPADTGARKELADMLFEAGQWAKARPMLESLLEDEDLLTPERRVEVHFRIANCAREVGDKESAGKHLDIALAIEPAHRESLQLKTELASSSDPFAYAASQLALANLAPPEEKAQRFADLGDRYTELGDNPTAREMYREALAHRPGDHLLLTKFLGLVTSDGDWSYSLDVIQRLVDTEKEPKVRARYRHLAGMIARDELDDHEQAVALFQDALHDDPFAFNVADELEQLLASVPDVEPLVRFYYKRLKDVQTEEGRPNERLRLWDQLGELCLQSDRSDDAVTAFEVALTLAPDDTERDARRQRLADLYFGNTKYDQKAIAQHQAVLRSDKRRIESYKSLRDLYERTKQPEKARAVEEALELVGDETSKLDKLFAPGAAQSAIAGAVKRQPLTNEDFATISRIDVDLALTALFAVVAPPFGVERARMRPPAPVPSKEHEPPAPAAAVLARVVTALGVKKPPVYLDREQSSACSISMRARDGVLTPVLAFGRAALDKTVDENELAFHVARALADLRNDRIARLLVPRAGELAQIIELASAIPGDASSHANRWLQTSLHPVELAQAQAIGARLREKTVHPMTAALGWLATTDRAADRIAFAVVGDLGLCARILEKEPITSGTDVNRTLELAWSSVTEEMLSVRGRIEGWLAPAVEPRRKTTTFGAVEPR
ncbi:MAG: tetratricopeptide repeat protein [Kofleriaceae bacterium]